MDQAIVWTNAGILLIWHLGIYISEIVVNSYILIQENIFEIVLCEMTDILSRSQCVKSKFVRRKDHPDNLS